MDKHKNIFDLNNIEKVIVSDSHKVAYELAKVAKCEEVYNFDSHTDLGYGGGRKVLIMKLIVQIG